MTIENYLQDMSDGVTTVRDIMCRSGSKCWETSHLEAGIVQVYPACVERAYLEYAEYVAWQIRVAGVRDNNINCLC